MNIKEKLITILIWLFSIIIPLVLVVGCIYLTAIGYTNEQTIEITVKDKYIKNSKNSIYIVVDTNGNAYQISDLALKGKFNSTDIYNQMEIGKTYIITTTGRRIHFLSLYPNINKIEESDENVC